MRALYYEAFGGPVTVETVPDPVPTPDGVVIQVQASGLCRSDWHGWMGHDADIRLPHVPGHELAGVIEAVGAGVRQWRPGDRVTLPFVCGCGSCPQCASGNHQVCDRQFQPGFTHWGSFAEYVAIQYADLNLVRLPECVDFVTAASLGCRFATSFRAVVDQGRISSGQWLAVHGCGGVGQYGSESPHTSSTGAVMAGRASRASHAASASASTITSFAKYGWVWPYIDRPISAPMTRFTTRGQLGYMSSSISAVASPILPSLRSLADGRSMALARSLSSYPAAAMIRRPRRSGWRAAR